MPFSVVLKQGRVAIIIRGRFAGRKVVILKTEDDGTKDHPFPHAIVAGIDKYPQAVTKDMDKGEIAKKSTIKPFLRIINFTHLLPTRYSLDGAEGLKQSVFDILEDGSLAEPSQREEARQVIQKNFEERYLVYAKTAVK